MHKFELETVDVKRLGTVELARQTDDPRCRGGLASRLAWLESGAVGTSSNAEVTRPLRGAPLGEPTVRICVFN
jgi:hypothetical protein